MAATAPIHSAEKIEEIHQLNSREMPIERDSLSIRHKYSKDSLEISKDILRFTDIGLLFFAGILGQFATTSHLPTDLWASHLRDILTAAVVAPFVLHRCGLYRDESFRTTAGALRSSLYGCAALALIGLVFGLSVRGLDRSSWSWVAIWFSSSFALIAGTRLVMSRIIGKLIREGSLSDRVAIVGGGPLADRLVDHLASLHVHHPSRCPIEVVGIFDDRSGRLPETCGFVRGTLDDLIALGKAGGFNRVLLTLPWSAETRLLDIRNRLQALSIDVSLCPDGIAFAIQPPRRSVFGDLPFYSIAQRPMRRWGVVAKRAEDIVLALVALAFFGPMMGLIALAIKLDSVGPALFRQRRHGFNNLEIDVLKFRTMRTDAADQSGGQQTRRGDSRITRVGGILRRTSLDELPQLLNVLMGHMSLVGPRPHPIGMKTKNLLCHEIVESYAHRHRVKPGITGWAQVNGFRGATTEPEHLIGRIEHDLYYIENWSRPCKNAWESARIGLISEGRSWGVSLRVKTEVSRSYCHQPSTIT